MVYEALPGGTSSPSISPGPQWAGAHTGIDNKSQSLESFLDLLNIMKGVCTVYSSAETCTVLYIITLKI